VLASRSGKPLQRWRLSRMVNRLCCTNNARPYLLPVIAPLAVASSIPRKCLRRKHFLLAYVPDQSQCGVRKTLKMAAPSYILFNKSLLQCRSLGARGGRAYGRNLRARRALIALLPTPPAAIPWRAAPQETTATAIALLDAQFPWLRGAEMTSRNQPPRRPRPRSPAKHSGESAAGCGRAENTLRRGPWTLTKR
jgi:hypothetical protein